MICWGSDHFYDYMEWQSYEIKRAVLLSNVKISIILKDENIFWLYVRYDMFL